MQVRNDLAPVVRELICLEAKLLIAWLDLERPSRLLRRADSVPMGYCDIPNARDNSCDVEVKVTPWVETHSPGVRYLRWR